MHAVCLISCLRLATEQHCILPQKGVNGKVYLIIHELKTHSGWSRRGTAQGGERVWWVGFLTISEYFIKYIYIYTYTKSYKNISSYIDITYIYRDHDQSLQHTRQTNTDTHPHKHTQKKEKNERANKCPCSRPPCKYMTVIIYNIYIYVYTHEQPNLKLWHRIPEPFVQKNYECYTYCVLQLVTTPCHQQYCALPQKDTKGG